MVSRLSSERQAGPGAAPPKSPEEHSGAREVPRQSAAPPEPEASAEASRRAAAPPEPQASAEASRRVTAPQEQEADPEIRGPADAQERACESDDAGSQAPHEREAGREVPRQGTAAQERDQAAIPASAGAQEASGPDAAGPEAAGAEAAAPEAAVPDAPRERAAAAAARRPGIAGGRATVAGLADDRPAGQVARQTGSKVERRAGGPVAARPDSEITPSWGRVAGTTLLLWLMRRSVRQRVLAAVTAVLVVFAAGGLTVALVRNTGSGRSARATGTAAPAPAGLAPVQAGVAARQQAAAWVAAQVSHSAVVSCDPAMCAALQADGFPAGDLMTLGPAASDPLGSAVIVSTAAVRSEFGNRLTTVYGPTVIASFGSGSAQVDVRVYAPGGAAAYLAALQADQNSRRSVGRQLLSNSRVSAAPAAQQQLDAGQVDSRLLITIATLAGQGPVRVVAFGDSGPGASPGAPLRLAELASPPGAKSGYLQSVLALLRAQQAPYLANSVTLAQLSGGQQIVRIEFSAPSPLGLVSG